MLTLKLPGLSLSSCLLLFFLGCQQNPYLDDDEGGQQPADSQQSGHPDNLSLPYAQGTKVRITVHADGVDEISAWKLQSDNPAVLSVDRLSVSSDMPLVLNADCTAVGAGDTVLRLLDDAGTERHRAPVSVGVADRVRILSHGALRLIEPTPDTALSTEVHEARVLQGNQGVFALLYQRGDQRLYGRGIVQFDPVAGLTVTNQTTTSSPATEWLFIQPLTTGTFSLTLRQGQTGLLTLPVVGVADSEIGSFGLVHQQAVAAPKMDQKLWVLIKARDMMGRDIQGVFGSWTLGGATQDGDGDNRQQTTGDLYRYQYADGQAQELAATHGPLRAAMTVTASKGAIYDTTYLGCGMGGHDPASSPRGPLGMVGALGLILVLLQRRRPGLVRRG